MFHKAGYKIILIAFVGLLAINFLFKILLPGILFGLLAFASVVFFILILQFFRNPTRTIPILDNNLVYAPADGKVVVIEEVEEAEYFNERRLQVSIFMSPLNVHVNRMPFAGIVKYFKYHPGKYLVAWHPKSSTENERSTLVFNNGKVDILVRQIAGAVARRIRCYVQQGDHLKQGEDFGFITFGSRVDVFLPLDAKLKVAIDDVVKGNLDVIASV